MSNTKQYDANTRLPLHLCPPILAVRVAAVMKAALSKPGRYPYNYQEVSSLTTYLDAAKRHIAKLEDGEWLDKDSGEPHAACVAANMAVILHCELKGTLAFDLPGETGEISALIDAYQEKYKSELNQRHPDVIKFEDGKDCGDPDCKAAECLQTRLERMAGPLRAEPKPCLFGTCPTSGCLVGTATGCCGPEGVPGLDPQPCPLVPEGLKKKGRACTREAGHDGPCAATA